MRQKQLGLLPPERKPSDTHNNHHYKGSLPNYGNRQKSAHQVAGSPIGYGKHPAIIAEAAEEGGETGAERGADPDPDSDPEPGVELAGAVHLDQSEADIVVT